MKKRRQIVDVLSMFALVGTTSSSERSEEDGVKEVIATTEAPKAIGPYSQAIKVGNMLFCSGQLPIDPETSEIVRGAIEAQTQQVLDNLGAVLKEAGMNYTDVVSVTVFIAEMDNFDRINKVYTEYFKEHPPARCAVEVSRLPKDVGIEITLIAIKM